jgi:predicted RNase H-like HicB family nuclease
VIASGAKQKPASLSALADQSCSLSHDHAYAPDLPGLHTQGDDLEDAMSNAQKALALHVEGLREEGRSIDTGVVRRKVQIACVTRVRLDESGQSRTLKA